MTHKLLPILLSFLLFKTDWVVLPENLTPLKSETWIILSVLLNFERLFIESRLTCRFLSLTIDIESQTKNFSMWAVGTFDIESSSRSLKSLIRPFLVINLIKRFRFGHELKHLEKYSGINRLNFFSKSQKGIGKRPGTVVSQRLTHF